MKISNKIVSAVMTAVLLTGCGASSKKYDFSDYELSHAISAKESQLDSLSLQPTEKNVVQKFSNIDEYRYEIMHDGSSE